MQDNYARCTEALGILKEFIEVHRDMFQLSIPMLIPIMSVFKYVNPKVDYRTDSEKLRTLKGRFDRLVPSVKGDDELAATLTEYCTALSETISLLQGVCSRLADAADGTREYPRREYKSDVSAYNASARKYQEIGLRLNELLPGMK